MKNILLGGVVGILLVACVFLGIKLKSTYTESQSQSDLYELALDSISSHYQAEQDSIKNINSQLLLKVDSLHKEYLKETQASLVLKETLDSVLSKIDSISTDSSYLYTQEILDCGGEKEYGYSGCQVTEIHKTLVTNIYLDSIVVNQDKRINLLLDEQMVSALRINNFENLVKSLETERDSLKTFSTEVIGTLKTVEGERDKYKTQSKIATYGAAGLGIVVILLLLIE